MPQKSYLKVFGYGLLLFVITNLLLLSVSFISQSDQPIDHWWVGTIVAILVAFFSWLFARRLHPTTSKQSQRLKKASSFFRMIAGDWHRLGTPMRCLAGKQRRGRYSIN